MFCFVMRCCFIIGLVSLLLFWICFVAAWVALTAIGWLIVVFSMVVMCGLDAWIGLLLLAC